MLAALLGRCGRSCGSGRRAARDALARYVVDDLLGRRIAALRQLGDVAGDRIHLVAQFEHVRQHLFLIVVELGHAAALAPQLHALEQHGDKESKRQQRYRQLDARTAVIGPEPILAHRPLPAGGFSAGAAALGAGMPYLTIMAMSWASRLVAAIVEMLRTMALPTR